MDYYDALEIANSEDPHLQVNDVLEALKVLADASCRYRALYEGAVKRMELLRDVAAKPDIFRKPWEDNDEDKR